MSAIAPVLRNASDETRHLQALFRPDILSSPRLLQRVQKWLNAGADANAPFTYQGEITRPLHTLMEHADRMVQPHAVLGALLQAGANPDALDGRQRTARERAVGSTGAALVQHLGPLEEAVDPDPKWVGVHIRVVVPEAANEAAYVSRRRVRC